ncbi:phosphatase PAP2 family protein [Chitinophaga rhizophila]|uniref:Phosphatase PAP2 family protein n=1 Tax=Chitinophaga rhizophila TaxID=2866212 RepID=A0ABS7GG34_9BACT|nr:phosphatase PAP2 family protein [Chitinophaga rhizophila]MBW8686652.1 phosphatase PAP2 family protein [Chitinophaga rhizophila]
MKTLLTLLGKNASFFLPFLLWIVAGALLQAYFTHDELFLAINHANTPWADVVMTGITYIGDGITFAVMLAFILVFRKYKLFLTAGTVLLLTTIIVQTAKHYYNEPRPALYFADANYLVHTVKWVTVHGSCSFPSGHTTTAFAMFTFLAMVCRNKFAGFAFITLALLAAHSRIYLAQHFFVDVYVGSIIGTTSSLVVYTLFHQSRRKEVPEVVTEPVISLT